MQTVTIQNVEEKLRSLSPAKLSAVYEFVSLLENSDRLKLDTLDGMLLAESVLSRELGGAEEDSVWADL